MQDLTHEIIKAVKKIVYSKIKNIEFCHNLHDSVKHKRRFFLRSSVVCTSMFFKISSFVRWKRKKVIQVWHDIFIFCSL